MRGIVVPERTDDFTADPVELFFDLVYVFAFSQIVGHLVESPTWGVAGESLLVFLLMWVGWSQLTWAANAVSGNSRMVRFLLLLATAAAVPMAAGVSTALEGGASVFAASLAVITLMGLGLLTLNMDRTSTVFESAVRYSVPTVLAMSTLVAGSFADGAAQVVIWLVALAVFVSGTVRAGGGDWIIRSGHFSERHGLIIIVALGEVIVAIGIPVVRSLQGEGFAATTVLALVASGLFAALLWWGYFDRVQPALELCCEQQIGPDRARFARDVYTYIHALIVGGVILAAVALEEITVHPDDDLAFEFRLMLLGGLGLYLGGVALSVARAFGVVARERIVCGAAVAVLALVASSWNGLVLLAVVDGALLAMLVIEHARVEGVRQRARQPA